LVLGGCHVDGYPVGKSMGFVEIAAKICGAAVDTVDVVSSINLGHTKRAGQACANFSPEILILQLGHFETTKPFRDGTASGTTTTDGKSLRSSAAPHELFNSRLNTLKWDVKNLVKQQIVRLSGTAFFDEVDIHRKLEVFCNLITSFDIPRVILLSPFPCADRVSLGCRLKLLEVFRENAMKSGFVYLDVMNSLLASANGKDIYYDGIHLNKRGHTLLGKLVSQCLMDTTLNPGL
jgi:hypothetical protein